MGRSASGFLRRNLQGSAGGGKCAWELQCHDWNYFCVVKAHILHSYFVFLSAFLYLLVHFCVRTYVWDPGQQMRGSSRSGKRPALELHKYMQHELHSAAWKQFYTGLWVGGFEDGMDGMDGWRMAEVLRGVAAEDGSANKAPLGTVCLEAIESSVYSCLLVA